MPKKGCTVAIIAVVAILLGGAGVAYWALQTRYNPYYRGKRVYDWADTAIWSPDPTVRREAALAVFD
jgi:hypothetical protein